MISNPENRPGTRSPTWTPARDHSDRAGSHGQHPAAVTSSGGSGSEIVLSYDAPDAFLDDTAREMVKIEARLVAAAGERYMTRMSPARAEAVIGAAGLEVIEHLTPQTLHARYFARRSDGLCPSTAERLITARTV